ncbi:MAG: adenylate/guanylate cyclase domain-containing protein [Lachnospiraceae bacterium]|nr:adenylate/guanylate cyclase domain-containing protein [Lachnospiraceae bacterium]MBP3505238.1 adenylate/guanylate cyclase domain-containing protein [Lachnospiraceae bacterium]
MNKKLIRDIVEGIVVAGLVFLLTISNLFYSIDYLLKDALYQIPRGIDSKIKIIAIDERTLDALGPIQTWSRSQYADLIHALNTYEDAKPAIIGFDIIFSGNVDEEGDIAFAQAAEESGNVVVASQFVYSEKSEVDEKGLRVYPIDSVIYPYAELREVVDLGYANVAQDSDGTVRRFIPEETYEGQEWYSFSRMIYERYCEQQGCATNFVKTDKYGRTLINYSGKPLEYECISMIDVLEGRIDCRAFKNSIVLVGAYATGMQDNFKVPNGYSKQMYGVEIHANILQSCMQNRFSVNGNPYVCGAILGLLSGILHVLFKRKKIVLSSVLLVVAIGGELAVGVVLNNQGITIGLINMPIIVVISYIYSLALGYIRERLKRKKVLQAFKKYVAPEIVEEIAKRGDFKIKLGGENRDIAVLFVDIRGFTTMSEVLEPEQVVEILNQYLNLTTQAIFKNKGTLDKFVGDATMAVFNSPFDLDDYEYRAVCAAMDIVAGGAALEEKLMKEFGRSVGFGVGVNCGPAVVGNVGCEFRMDFTAIGDTVNTAARLEANAKKGQVLISDTIYERVKDRIEVEEVGEIPLKGKSKGVFVYSVVALKDA